MKRWLAAFMTVLLLPFCACGTGSAPASLAVTALALDGGNCTLLAFDADAVMIDAGNAGDGEAILAELHAQGISTLSALLLTQYAPEHAGGAPRLLEQVRVQALYLPAYEPDTQLYRDVLAAADAAGCKVVRVTEDRAVTVGAAGFELWASSVAYDGANDGEQSLAAAMQYGEHRLVFLGDAKGAWLNTLCYGNYNLTCDVIQMPQHGAWLSDSFELIAFAFARYAILTDSQSRPADSRTVSGLKLIGCKVWQTGNGTVRLHSDGKQLTAQ